MIETVGQTAGIINQGKKINVIAKFYYKLNIDGTLNLDGFTSYALDLNITNHDGTNSVSINHP